MSYIIKNSTQGSIVARLTDAGRKKLSEGKLKVNYFAAGEKVGAFDVFDEVASGNSQAYIAAEYYWKGKHAAFNYFTSVPFGMTTVAVAVTRQGGSDANAPECQGKLCCEIGILEF